MLSKYPPWNQHNPLKIGLLSPKANVILQSHWFFSGKPALSFRKCNFPAVWFFSLPHGSHPTQFFVQNDHRSRIGLVIQRMAKILPSLKMKVWCKRAAEKQKQQGEGTLKYWILNFSTYVHIYISLELGPRIFLSQISQCVSSIQKFRGVSFADGKSTSCCHPEIR